MATYHEHWRESLFFILHPRDGLGDVVILTLAHFPARQEMDSLQLGRIGGTPTIAHHVRPYDGDPHTMAVGPVRIDIAEPFRTVHLHVDDVAEAPVALDLTFHARTAAYGLRRGTMRAGHELIWDQSHMVQSGTFTGTFTHDGTTYEVDDWWGQRDHSWGIRNHARVPMWMWLAVQLPDGMAALWHWEYANGARVYTDGCFAPADGSDPIAVVDVKHDLHWIDADGDRRQLRAATAPTSPGIAGRVELVLENGQHARARGARAVGRSATASSAAASTRSPSAPTTARTGTAIYELTGAHHHRYFPVPRAERLPPNG